MSTVYVVIRGDYEEQYVIAVFASEALAEAHAARVNGYAAAFEVRTSLPDVATEYLMSCDVSRTTGEVANLQRDERQRDELVDGLPGAPRVEDWALSGQWLGGPSPAWRVVAHGADKAAVGQALEQRAAALRAHVSGAAG